MTVDDPYNLMYEGLGPRESLEVGAMGVSMQTAGIIVISVGIVALLLMPAAMLYMSLKTGSERSRWRREERKNGRRLDALERDLRAKYFEREKSHAAAREELRSRRVAETNARPSSAASSAVSGTRQHRRASSSRRESEDAGLYGEQLSRHSSGRRPSSSRAASSSKAASRTRAHHHRAESSGHEDPRRESHGHRSRRRDLSPGGSSHRS